MIPEYNRLMRALRLARRPQPTDLAAAMSALPEVGRLPDPWWTWTLFCLVRLRRRQRWVARVVHTLLRQQPPPADDGEPRGWWRRLPAAGFAPRMVEWEYQREGLCVRLTHRVTGEKVAVTFYDNHAEHIGIDHFALRLESLRAPEPAEARLLALHASLGTIGFAFEDLQRDGLLESSHPALPPVLSGYAWGPARAINAFCTAWADPHAAPGSPPSWGTGPPPRRRPARSATRLWRPRPGPGRSRWWPGGSGCCERHCGPETGVRRPVRPGRPGRPGPRPPPGGGAPRSRRRPHQGRPRNPPQARGGPLGPARARPAPADRPRRRH